jgi:hypothetical protein
MARGRDAPRIIASSGGLVVERDPRRASGRLLRQDDMEASYVDLADPSHLEFDYLRWIRVVLRAARARRVLHVGGGACALPRALAAEDPAGLQQVCELDAGVLELARRHLGLRRTRGLRVRRAEGRRFVAAQPAQSWDAIVVDAFAGAVVPPNLITAQAVGDMARVAPLALVNVIDNRAARHVATVAAGLATAYPRVWAIGGRSGNTVVGAGQREPDLDLIAARVAADASPGRLLGSATMARIASGTSTLRDEDVAGGPPANGA